MPMPGIGNVCPLPRAVLCRGKGQPLHVSGGISAHAAWAVLPGVALFSNRLYDAGGQLAERLTDDWGLSVYNAAHGACHSLSALHLVRIGCVLSVRVFTYDKSVSRCCVRRYACPIVYSVHSP